MCSPRPVVVSVSVLREKALGTRTRTILLFHVCTVPMSGLQTCFTALQLFIPSLTRCRCLFVLAFKPILLLGLLLGCRGDLKVLLTHYFVAYGLLEI